MPRNSCTITAAEKAAVASVLNPADISGFVRTGYTTPPAGLTQSGFTINIYVGATAYDFTWFYKSKSMRMEENFGPIEAGVANFEFWDTEKVWPPFIPINDQRIEILNQNSTEYYFRGRIKTVDPIKSTEKQDGSKEDAGRHKVIAVDRTIEFGRNPVAEHYVNKTTYFIAKDLITRYTDLDASQIDATKGITIADRRFNQETVAEALEWILNLESTTTIWYDPQTDRIYMDETGKTSNVVLELTDDNLYDYFTPKTFSLRRDTRQFVNRVILDYIKRTNSIANVSNSNNTVLGSGTNWTRYVTAGTTQFQRDGDDAVYTVQEVNGDGDVYLSSPYQGVTGTGVAVSFSGSRGLKVDSDGGSIAAMAALLGNDGIFAVKVPPENAPMTDEQATLFAKAYRQKLSGLVQGQAIQKNANGFLDMTGLRAGKVLRVVCPIKHKISGYVVIQQIVRQDIGGIINRSQYNVADNRIDPGLQIELDFTDHLLYDHNQLDRIRMDLRKLNITDDQIIQAITYAYDIIFIKDCSHVVDAVSASERINISDASDAEDHTADKAKTWRWGPVSGGNNVAYWLGLNNISFWG